MNSSGIKLILLANFGWPRPAKPRTPLHLAIGDNEHLTIVGASRPTSHRHKSTSSYD